MIKKIYSINKFVVELFKDNTFVGYYSGKDQQGNILYGNLQNAKLCTENHKNRICEDLNNNYREEWQFKSKEVIDHHTDYFYHKDEDFDYNDIRVLWIICRKTHSNEESVFLKDIQSKTVFIKKKKTEIIHKFETTTDIDEAHVFKGERRPKMICKELSHYYKEQYEFYPQRFYIRREEEVELVD